MDGYLFVASIVVVLVYGYAALQHITNAIRFRTARSVRGLSLFGFSLFASGVALTAVAIYFFNIVGIYPNPLPANVGRFLILILGVLVIFTAYAIRRLAP